MRFGTVCLVIYRCLALYLVQIMLKFYTLSKVPSAEYTLIGEKLVVVAFKRPRVVAAAHERQNTPMPDTVSQYSL